MEVFQHAATQMLILFVIVFLGAIARKKHLMNDDFDALLSRLVMTVALPGMILDSVLSNTNLPSSETIFMMLGYSAVVYIILCALAALVARLPRSWRAFCIVVFRKRQRVPMLFLLRLGIQGSLALRFWLPFSVPIRFSMAQYITFLTTFLCFRLV